MRITFDPTKNARNIAEQSLLFERVADSIGRPRWRSRTTERIMASDGFG
jgi:uncharacterized DUF497 family protein